MQPSDRLKSLKSKMKLASRNLGQTSERTSVEAFLQHRDERSFRKLYGRYTPPIYQLALRILGGKESEAEEVVQDVWVRAVQRLSQFRWESKFQTWLSGITIHRCQETFRQRSKQKNQIDIETDGLPLQSVPAEKFDQIDLDAAIAELPDGFREVLVLHDIEGYTHNEIGEFLGIEPGTSKSQLFHARRAMRRLLLADDVT